MQWNHRENCESLCHFNIFPCQFHIAFFLFQRTFQLFLLSLLLYSHDPRYIIMNYILNPWSWFLHRLLKSYNFKLLRYFVVHIIIHPPGEENIWYNRRNKTYGLESFTMNNNHRITLNTNKNIIVEFTNDTINRSE